MNASAYRVGESNGTTIWIKRERVLLSLAGLFLLTNSVALSYHLERRITWSHLGPIISWVVLFAAVHWSLSRNEIHRDPYLLPLAGLFSGWGLILQDRLAPPFLHRQLAWLALSVAAMVLAANLNPKLSFLRRYRYSWALGGMLLLLATLLFGVNPSGEGAALWLPVPLAGRTFFQPSEMMKLLLVVFLASYFDERGRFLRLYPNGIRKAIGFIGPLAIMWGLSIVLLIWQRDLGAATLFLLIFLGLLYISTGQTRYVAAGGVLLVVAGYLAYRIFDVVALRIDMWWNPWPEVTGRGFQIAQSLYAVATGGIMGQGVGQGFPTFIPVVHSDFVFSAIGEEWGFIGLLSVILGFTLLTMRALRIAEKVKSRFRIYLTAGIGLVFGIQSFLIMAGVTKLLPLTGVTLPFISYGGSSLIMSSIMLGILLAQSSENEEYRSHG